MYRTLGVLRLWAIIMFVTFAHTVVAQQRVADSLMVVLKKHTRDDKAKVDIMNNIAYLVYKNNSAMTADYAQKSGQLSDQLGYEKGKAASLWLLGLSNLGNDKKQSLDYFQQALTISEKISDQQGMANCLVAMGNALRDLGHSEQGDQCYTRALKLATAIGDKQIEIKCLTNISRSLTSKGKYAQAIEGLEKATSLANEIGDKPLLSRCYHNIGSIYLIQSNYPVGLDYLLMSLRVNEELQDKSGILANLLNISGVKSDQNDYKGALESAKKAMAIAKEIRDTMNLSVCLTNIGNIYISMGDNQALEYFQKALALLGDNSIKQSISILTSMGTIHRKNGNYALALNSYNEALKLSEKIGLKRGIAQVWYDMGMVYLLQKDYAKALDYTLKSSNLVHELGKLDLLKDVHSQLADIYAAQNDFKAAYEHHKLFKSYNDSIFNANNVKKIADLESAYKYDKERQHYEAEKQKREMAIKDQRTIILTLSVAFIFMLLLAITLFRLYRLKKRTNTVLLQQKAKIEELNEEYISLNEELKVSNEALVYAKQTVEKSEEKLRRIIGNSNDIIVLVDENKHVLFVSDVASGITGFSTDEIRQSFIDFVHPDDKETMKLHWGNIIKSNASTDTVQFRYKLKTDGYLWFEAVAQNFLKNPAIGAVLSNIRNIDVQKKAEVAFKEREALQKKLLQLEIEKINNELDTNQKAMTAAALQLVQNSERDAQSIKVLEDIMAESAPEVHNSIKTLIANYKFQACNSNWDEFEFLFQKVHHSFHDKLNEQYPELTPNERKLCIFMKLNMNSKQIAQITFQSEEALKKARLRLRKKLDIDRDTNLVSFIQGL